MIAPYEVVASSRRALQERCKLALEFLDDARAPACGHRLGHRVGEDLLFTVLQSIEDAARRGLGRRLRDLEASIHIGVDGSEEDGVDGDALARQEGTQRLRCAER